MPRAEDPHGECRFGGGLHNFEYPVCRNVPVAVHVDGRHGGVREIILLVHLRHPTQGGGISGKAGTGDGGAVTDAGTQGACSVTGSRPRSSQQPTCTVSLLRAAIYLPKLETALVSQLYEKAICPVMAVKLMLADFIQ